MGNKKDSRNARFKYLKLAFPLNNRRNFFRKMFSDTQEFVSGTALNIKRI